jgi:hypothetical protein
MTAAKRSSTSSAGARAMRHIDCTNDISPT